MIYLDHNATTPVAETAIEKIKECSLLPLNASSIHSFGRKAQSIIEFSRVAISKLLGFYNVFKEYTVTFTASGTEANNLIMSNFIDGDIFISAIEHHSIFEWQKLSKNVQVIKVDNNGILDIDDLNNKLAGSLKNKKLVSVMLANNETGVVQPLPEIVRLAQQYGALTHSDLVQAVGKIDVDITEIDIDFATVSGHKFGGPIGAAALIYKAYHHLMPMIIGGGQEKGVRSGTENVACIAGFGAAVEQAVSMLAQRNTHILNLRDYLEHKIKNHLPSIEFAGENVERLPNTSLIINRNKKAEIQLIAFDMAGIAVSSGSACSSGKVGKSHVLEAMGYDDRASQSAIRVSLAAGNTKQDIDYFIKIFTQTN